MRPTTGPSVGPPGAFAPGHTNYDYSSTDDNNSCYGVMEIKHHPIMMHQQQLPNHHNNQAMVSKDPACKYCKSAGGRGLAVPSSTLLVDSSDSSSTQHSPMIKYNKIDAANYRVRGLN